MTTPREQLDALRALSEAATPGEWHAADRGMTDAWDVHAGPHPESGCWARQPDGSWPPDLSIVNGIKDTMGKGNAQFIVAAVNYVRSLLAAEDAEEASCDHEWEDAPDDEEAWYCPKCGAREDPVIRADETNAVAPTYALPSWPTADEFAAMSASEVNALLESRGHDVRVVEQPVAPDPLRQRIEQLIDDWTPRSDAPEETEDLGRSDVLECLTAIVATPSSTAPSAPRAEREREARIIGYRKGRLEAWAELLSWAEDNLDIAKDNLTPKARAALAAKEPTDER